MSALKNWTAKNIGTSGDIDKTVGLLDKILKVTNAADAKLPDQVRMINYYCLLKF